MTTKEYLENKLKELATAASQITTEMNRFQDKLIKIRQQQIYFSAQYDLLNEIHREEVNAKRQSDSEHHNCHTNDSSAVNNGNNGISELLQNQSSDAGTV